jgi:transaldolase / glucose-6-phosphate isomerase
VNPLVQLQEYGQSPWYDYIRRGLITSGELQSLIDQDGLMGITSNPSIFEKAISGSTDYNQSLKQISSEVTGVKQIYETLAIEDIQEAADLMRPVYERTQTRDGYVSLEVSPHLAHDTDGTIQEAMRLHKAIGRENVMIKVPATPEGIPAIESLISEGININVTLLFSVEVYEQAAWAYISGVEKLANKRGDIKRISSVASFFVSRIDTLVDTLLEAKLKESSDERQIANLRSLLGKMAIANAKIAYQRFQTIFSSERFEALKRKGGKVQRLLWASTGTKNPRYPDTYYVDALVGPDTVNTMPVATFNAFRDHGSITSSLTTGLDEAMNTMRHLADRGIDMKQVTQKLLVDGVRLFTESFDQIMGVIQQKRNELLGPKLDRLTYALGSFEARIKDRLIKLQQSGFSRRFWGKDPNLWRSDQTQYKSILNALGWLTLPEQEVHHLDRISKLVESIREEGFVDVVLLGMGGSSLCPEVCRLIFGVIPNYPELHVLDSTVPAQIRNLESRLNLSRTLFIVSSKSGTTTETLAMYRYFFDRVRQTKGEKAGENFVAITDPGSFLENLARESKFREILPGVPDVGGRYSALSHFGIVPAAIMGVNIEHLLYRAERMRHSCDSCVPTENNPGVVLGVILGELAKQGRDKVTFIASPPIRSLGAWLEQLIAESTGKNGKGIIPIDEEALGLPEAYSEDRLFIYIRYAGGPDPDQEKKVSSLEKAGHPVVRIDLWDLINLGEEFFLWEIATAVAGSILGVNAFDQPNVQESKDNTKALLDAYQKKGQFEKESPIFIVDSLRVYSSDASRGVLQGAKTIEEILSVHLSQAKKGDYVAMNVYVERTEIIHNMLQNIRLKIRDRKKIATTLGYGPRFLHSTGQLHKGGPNSGLFLQVTASDVEDLAIPGEAYTFGILKVAQALGDFSSLNKWGRRGIRIDLGPDVKAGLSRLQEAVKGAL